MQILKDLCQILKILTKQEKEVCFRYLNEFSAKKGDKNTLSYTIVAKLIRTPTITFSNLKALVDPEMKDRTFERLLHRTKSKVLQSLVLPINTDRPSAYWKSNKIYFELKNKLSQAWILYGRGADTQALKLYRSVAKIAKQYEEYHCLVEALQRVAEIELIRFKKSTCSELEEFRKYTAVLRDVESLILVNAQLQNNFEFQELNGRFSNKIEGAIKMANEIAENTGSKTATYFQMKFEMDLLKRNLLWGEVQSKGAEIIQHLDRNPEIANHQRVGNTWGMMSHAALNLRRWEQGVLYIKKAQEYFTKGSYNYYNALQYEFLGEFYLGNHVKAAKTIRKTLNGTSNVVSAHRQAIRKYYNACNLLLLGKTSQSALIFAEDTIELDKYKDDWNVGVRLMTIYLQFEGSMTFKFPENYIRSLLRHIKEIESEYSISKRTLAAVDILLSLAKNSFDFVTTAVEKAHDLDNLRKAKNDFAWNPLSSEIIRFDVWFDSKLKEVSYVDLMSTSLD